LVEHATENRSVGGSIPPLGTIFLKCKDKDAFQSGGLLSELYKGPVVAFPDRAGTTQSLYASGLRLAAIRSTL